MEVQELSPKEDNPALKSFLEALDELKRKLTKTVAALRELKEENAELKEQLAHAVKGDSARSSFGKGRDASGLIDVGERLLYLSPDEREALERQINDLLTRINAHLG